MVQNSLLLLPIRVHNIDTQGRHQNIGGAYRKAMFCHLCLAFSGPSFFTFTMLLLNHIFTNSLFSVWNKMVHFVAFACNVKVEMGEK